MNAEVTEEMQRTLLGLLAVIMHASKKARECSITSDARVWSETAREFATAASTLELLFPEQVPTQADRDAERRYSQATARTGAVATVHSAFPEGTVR